MVIWCEQIDEIASLKQIELKKVQCLPQGRTDSGFEFQKGKKQIHDQGSPDLCGHSISEGAEEGFNFQVA